MRKQIIVYITTFSFLILATIGVILYGKGYLFNFGKDKITIFGTGLLAAKSQPDGAGIYINNHLTSATDNTINLAPGDYNIRIVKDGYFPWEKKIKIEKEVVSTVYALLFPIAPKLESITDTGVSNPIIDPSRTKIAYTVSSFDSLRKNGVYMLDMSSRPILTLQSASSQVVDDAINSFSLSSLSWSPDAREILATISAQNTNYTYLLKTNFNQNPQDVTQTLASVQALWQKEKEDKEKSQIFGLKTKLKNLINEDFKILSWSNDETKILYMATNSATLPLIIDPPLIGTNSTLQERKITKNSIYVYDIKEDKNYKILDTFSDTSTSDSESKLPLKWFPDSKHLIYVDNKKISIMEYDGQNKTIIFAGPFIDGYVFPWPDISRIVILTDLGNPNITPNLYTISLR